MPSSDLKRTDQKQESRLRVATRKLESSIKMDGWQGLRLKRAVVQGIRVQRVDCSEDSFFFLVDGVSDNYIVEISQHVELWPPRCTCDDNHWRPDVLCKHIIACLALMGVPYDLLQDSSWEPEQNDLHEYLFHAPDCVGCALAPNRATCKGTSNN